MGTYHVSLNFSRTVETRTYINMEQIIHTKKIKPQFQLCVSYLSLSVCLSVCLSLSLYISNPLSLCLSFSLSLSLSISLSLSLCLISPARAP